MNNLVHSRASVISLLKRPVYKQMWYLTCRNLSKFVVETILCQL